MPYIVARMKDGQPFDWLHEEGPNGHTICTNPIAAKVFDTYDEAADAAGRCMSHFTLAEYRAMPMTEGSQ